MVVGLGLIVVTLSVVGVLRLPCLPLRVHAASKAVFQGVIVILFASAATADARLAGRALLVVALLVVALLLVTTPISSHALTRADYLKQRRPPPNAAVSAEDDQDSR